MSKPRVMSLIATLTLCFLSNAELASASEGSCASPETSGFSQFMGGVEGALGSIDWNRVGGDAWAFTKGAGLGILGAAVTTITIGFLMATFPAAATGILIGAAVFSGALLILATANLVRNWDRMNERDKVALVGNVAGAALGAGTMGGWYSGALTAGARAVAGLWAGSQKVADTVNGAGPPSSR